jgi:hypothetical protein
MYTKSVIQRRPPDTQTLRRNQMLLNFKASLTKSSKNASSAETPKYEWIGVIFVDVVEPDAS